MLPQKRSSLFGVTRVTQIVDGKILEHSSCFASVRVMARGAGNLHIAKLSPEQMCSALIERFALLNMTAETCVLNRWGRQHMHWQTRS
jgi:hypothetical protein